MKHPVFLFLSLVLTTGGVRLSEALACEPSRYEVRRASVAMVIDGIVSGAEWDGAGRIATFSDVFVPGRQPRQATTARMLWDDRYLYITFECVDDDIRATMTQRDDQIYAEEVVEVFIDPEGMGRHYWEIDVSPRNVVADLMIPRAGWQAYALSNQRYDVRSLRTAVNVRGTLNDPSDRDEGWSVEMAVPWSDFAGRRVSIPPKDGDSWRMNLFRVDMPDSHGRQDQFLSWSASPGVFHEPRNFGVVTFRK